MDDELGQFADAIVLLAMAESEGGLRRFIGVHKHRGSDHAKDLREIQVDAQGLHIATERTRHAGVLTGSTRRGLDDPEDEVVPRLESPLAALREILDSGHLDEGESERFVGARAERSIVDAVLREHFGITAFHELAVDEQG